jgi:hypothetical protein
MMRLSSDSARDENSSANVAASQKVTRTPALDRFMVFLLMCANVLGFSFYIDAESQLTLCDFDVRRDIAWELWRSASRISSAKRQEP